ncbi:hypothetical protein DFH07DRAFT_773913 [Mycena maculata]|uniref:Zn(2)-C6 fungal-type domain-containing protein n=1 Tax=Mycena maculata TaxID=230809 RepID=A0AAD7J1B1_9AGAR|nr:hypothetical protein DFH07DRAFT_773913 [Mycena maculata]
MPHSPPENSELLSASSSQKKRVNLACVQCRKLKVKCIRTETHPLPSCQRCKKRGLRCEYVSTSEQDAQSMSTRQPAPTAGVKPLTRSQPSTEIYDQYNWSDSVHPGPATGQFSTPANHQYDFGLYSDDSGPDRQQNYGAVYLQPSPIPLPPQIPPVPPNDYDPCITLFDSQQTGYQLNPMTLLLSTEGSPKIASVTA